MRLKGDDVIFGQTVFCNKDILCYFLAEIRHKHPDFFEEIGKSCDEFVAHHKGLRENDIRRRRNAVQFFLQYVCGKIASLYRANGSKIPPEIVPIFNELKNGCDSPYKIQERFDSFRKIDSGWAEYFIMYAEYEGLCDHGLGAVYAWAEAFLEAQKREEERAVESAEIAKRTKSLNPGWIEGIDLNLPEGPKKIDEE